MKVAVYNLSGKKVEDMNLSADVFGVSANNALLHQAYVAQSGNRRKVVAHTKGRSDVAGSGKKPWRQKGTGNARVGTIRNPIWRGGGVAFGPTRNRNFKKDIPLKMKRKALAIAISEKVRSKALVILENMKLKDRKTKTYSQILENLRIVGSALVGLSKDESGNSLAIRNIPKVDPIETEKLNVFDVLNHKYLILSKESVKFLESKYKK
jgi:large subunit ribosomal protein L4